MKKIVMSVLLIGLFAVVGISPRIDPTSLMEEMRTKNDRAAQQAKAASGDQEAIKAEAAQLAKEEAEIADKRRRCSKSCELDIQVMKTRMRNKGSSIK
jgi:hypothetical protein